MIGKVIEIFITQNDANKTRRSVDSIQVDENGIIGDKFYAKDSQRLILITSLDSYKLTKENDIHLEYGSLGENLLIDVNPYSLLPGEQLVIGNTTLKITQNCTLCKGLSSIDSKLPKLLKNDRGIFAKVVGKGGVIKLQDKVKF
ncbi:MAG: MOSC domain-containing protein [Campylobacterales bacterium]|nr:MOSC domain-containing protein [Campylobacterales bacterium]